MHVLTRRRSDGGQSEDAIVLNPLGKVETARVGAESKPMLEKYRRVKLCLECIGKRALLCTSSPPGPGCVL